MGQSETLTNDLKFFNDLDFPKSSLNYSLTMTFNEVRAILSSHIHTEKIILQEQHAKVDSNNSNTHNYKGRDAIPPQEKTDSLLFQVIQ